GLRARARRSRAQGGRARRDARRRATADHPRAQAFARRTHEVRAPRGAAAPPARAVPRRADARPRHQRPGGDPRVPRALQPTLRRDGAAHEPLHGRHHRAVLARPHHPRRQPPLRRQPHRDRRAPDAVARDRAAPRRARAARGPGGVRRGLAARRDVGVARRRTQPSAALGRRDLRSLAPNRPVRQGTRDRTGDRPAAQRTRARHAMIYALRVFAAQLHTALVLTTTYRAEMILWALSGTLPIILMGVWGEAARTGAMPYTPVEMVRYFVAVLVVRQLTFVWVIWEFEEEVVTGRLSSLLLRPIDPVWNYVANHLAERLARLPMIALLVGLCFWLHPEAIFVPSPAVAATALGVPAVRFRGRSPLR